MADFNPNNPTASGMVLTFDDEFNTASVSSDSVANNTLWNDHLWYEAPNDGVTVSNGIATIVNTDLSTINSSGQGFAQKYGYFEADLELPNQSGAWPAFWLMSQQHAVNGANPASEIDIMEGQGVDPNLYFTTLHYDTGTSQDTYNPNPNWTANLGVNLETSFHRYGLLWSPDSNEITFYFDGAPIATATKYSTTDYSPDMVILSTSEGNMIGNNYTNGTSPPLYADYVRIYQFTSQDPTAVIAQQVSPPSGDTDPTVLANADGVTPGSGSGTASADPPPSSGSDPAPSANGTVIAGTSGEIVTAAGNIFALNASGQITENGTVMPSTGNVTEIAYVNGTVYQEATSQNLWWSYNESTNTWTQTTDPLTTSDPSSNAGGSGNVSTPSADGTIIHGATGDIVTAAGNVFAINASGAITENGAAMPATTEVTELVYMNGTVYQEATSQNLWWSLNETSGVWTPTSDPLTNANPPSNTTPSVNDTIIHGATGDIVTAAGNVFAINASGAITENGSVMPATTEVTELVYMNGTVYQEATSQNLWWSLNETTGVWTPTIDPIATEGSSSGATTPSADGTIVTGATGSIVDSAGNVFAINASGEITENGAVMPATTEVTELAYLGGTVYQEATSQNLWWSYNETTHAWTPTSDPLTATTSTSGVQAEAPTLTFQNAEGAENSAIPLSITASQAASDLAASNLSIHIEVPTGVTLSEGTATVESGGYTMYTLDASQLAHLTVTPPEGYTGSLELLAFATDTEPSSGTIASSTPQELVVTVDSSSHAAADASTTSAGANSPDASHVLTLQVSGDLYATSSDPSGDPQITVTVDGHNEGTFDITAHHSQGQTQTISIDNVDPSVAHQVQVSFANDAWDGVHANTDGYDRNVYVESVSLNGHTIAGDHFASNDASMGQGSLDPNAAVMLQNGTASYSVPVSEPTMAPTETNGSEHIYALSAMPQSAEQITSFNPAEDVLNLTQLLKSIGYTGSNPIADHVVNLVETSHGSTNVMIDPTGHNPDHGTTVLTLDHVLPHSIPAADILH